MRFLLRLLFVALAAFGLAGTAEAQLSFQLRTGDAGTNTQSMSVDSNNCPASGPRAAYVGGVITNGGATTVTNIVATMGGLGSGFFLAGNQAATQSVGSLAAGQSTGVYWFVGYGCTFNATSSPVITITSSGATVAPSVTLTGRSAISANAGGQVTGTTLGNGAVVGQTIWFDTTFSFGGANAGDEYFLQPSGGQTFDAGCFRMVASEIRSSNVTAIGAGLQNRLYFVASAKQSGSGFTATVRYYFEYQCAGATTVSRPYAVQTSGNANIKYTGNYDGAGSYTIAFQGATNPFTIAKTSDISSAIAGTASTVKYTVTITSPSVFDSRVSQIVDTLPAGAKFLAIDAASNVTAANSSSVPAANATGTLTFTGRQDQSYLLPAGGTVKLIYTVLMPSAAGTYVNSAQGQFGQATTPTVGATFKVIAPAALTMVKSSQAAADPFNGNTNPKLIPGARAAYTVTIANPNAFAATSDSIVVIDKTPANLQLYVGNISGTSGGPVRFQDGSTASALTYSYTSLASQTDDVDFSSDNGATWTYVPTANAQGADANVTHVRIRPKGAMAANSSFSLIFGYIVK